MRVVQKENISKPFGSSVRVWRNRLGISQEELAERASLHRTYISDVERGARNVSLASIEKLAHALEVSVPTLLSYSQESPAPEGSMPANGLVDILFVEDNDDDIDLAVQALRRANIANHIHTLRDGAAALDFLFCTGEFAQRQPGDRPQLILLDLGLPKIDGLEVLRRIKSDPRTRQIPVVVLTVSSRDQDILMSKRFGAEAYIIKPVDFKNFSEVAPKVNLQWALLKPAPALRI
jgi:CheY-like chemotaxis protein/DNA-binding XRE family transcriptional regulator